MDQLCVHLVKRANEQSNKVNDRIRSNKSSAGVNFLKQRARKPEMEVLGNKVEKSECKKKKK